MGRNLAYDVLGFGSTSSVQIGLRTPDLGAVIQRVDEAIGRYVPPQILAGIAARLRPGTRERFEFRNISTSVDVRHWDTDLVVFHVDIDVRWNNSRME
jgi:hypothetical protein